MDAAFWERPARLLHAVRVPGVDEVQTQGPPIIEKSLGAICRYLITTDPDDLARYAILTDDESYLTVRSIRDLVFGGEVPER